VTSDITQSEFTTPENPLVSIIVLNCNGMSRLKTCFDAVIHQNYPNYEIIFVDNGSTDGSLQWAGDKLSGTSLSYRIEALHRNLGINRGKNHGAGVARGKYLWLLDNDIAPQASTLGKLVAYMEENPDVALCGSVLTDFENPQKIIGGGFRLRVRYRRNKPVAVATDSDDGARQVTYVSGGIMFVSASAWQQVGGFEDSAVLYLDDSDFGVRCWLAGFRVALVSGCSARHWDEGAGNGAWKKHHFRRRITGVTRFILRNLSPFPMSVHLLTFEIFLLFKTAKHMILDKQPAILLEYLAAQYHCVVGIAEILRQRRTIQRSRRISRDVFLHLEDSHYPDSRSGS
jgi:GT2 family glycosyltransferase